MNQPDMKDKNAKNAFLSSPQAANGDDNAEIFRLWLSTWGVKRANQEQLNAIGKLANAYPLSTIKEFIEWARIQNMAFGRSLVAAPAALSRWQKPKPSGNGTKPRGDLAPVEMTDEERRLRYGDWGKVKL
jgi:hypothetical protein